LQWRKKYGKVNSTLHKRRDGPCIFEISKEIDTMNKAELIAAVAEKAGLSKKDSEAAVTAALDAITAALEDGDKVQLVGFGSFEVKSRAARTGRNPKTKEAIEIPASKVPVFKAGKVLKDIVGK
jgi:DNA-binding protein HU-beta